MADTVADTLVGRAPVCPCDFYVTGGGQGSAGIFERYHDATGGTYENSVEVRTRVNTTVTYPVGLYVRYQVDASAVIASAYGINVAMRTPDASSTVSNYYAISIGMYGSAVPGYDSCIRFYNHATAATPAVDSVFHLANSGGTPFTSLFHFGGQVLPVSAYGSETTGTYKVACKVGTDVAYLVLFK